MNVLTTKQQQYAYRVASMKPTLRSQEILRINKKIHDRTAEGNTEAARAGAALLKLITTYQ